MTACPTLRWLWTSVCLAALLGSGCAHWGWKKASDEKLGKAMDSEVSFVETPLAKPLADAATVSANHAKPVTRSPEDEALIDDTLARLRSLPDMKPEEVDEIAKAMRHPTQPVPRLLLQQYNAMAKFKQEQAKKAAAPAVETPAATPTEQVAAKPEPPKPLQQPSVIPASAHMEVEKEASEPPVSEETSANTDVEETEDAEAPAAAPPPRRLLDRVRRAKEGSGDKQESGIFGGKVGAHVAPRLEPEMLALAHVTHKPATLEKTNTAEELAWDQHLAEAVSKLEAELKDTELEPVEAARRQAQLRLLYLVAERKDDALREITDLDTHEQDYWTNQVHSLSISLAPEGTPVKGRRAAMALRPLRDAVDHLAAQATLDVKNVALCKSVTIWGNYTEFEEYTFKPNQEALLYFEVENFTSAETSDGYATEFVSSYEVFDSAGRRVAEQQFPIAKETCKNRRRDYFIRYHWHVPKTLAAGDYTLQLTVEDQKGHKFGQGSVKFKVSG